MLPGILDSKKKHRHGKKKGEAYCKITFSAGKRGVATPVPVAFQRLSLKYKFQTQQPQAKKDTKDLM